MTLTERFNNPGTHSMSLPGVVGSLEAMLTVPEHWDKRSIALLGHPHSLFGGSMNNKVVTTLARAFEVCDMASLRFNFRGVGQSVGTYDAGVGESEDMLMLAKLFKEEIPDASIIYAGFSFGSFVAYRAAAQSSHALLISIAPPVQHFDHHVFSNVPTPWVIIQPEDDEVVPIAQVNEFVSKSKVPIQYVRIPQTGHFFHGRLALLQSCLIDMIKT